MKLSNKSYILIQLLQESIHFLFLLTKEGKSALESRQPQKQKIKENCITILTLQKYMYATH